MSVCKHTPHVNAAERGLVKKNSGRNRTIRREGKYLQDEEIIYNLSFKRNGTLVYCIQPFCRWSCSICLLAKTKGVNPSQNTQVLRKSVIFSSPTKAFLLAHVQTCLLQFSLKSTLLLIVPSSLAGESFGKGKYGPWYVFRNPALRQTNFSPLILNKFPGEKRSSSKKRGGKHGWAPGGHFQFCYRFSYSFGWVVTSVPWLSRR